MTPIGMIAYRDFTYGGVDYSKAQRFSVPPVHASVLVRLHHARFVDENDPPIEEQLVITPAPTPLKANAPTPSQATDGRPSSSRRQRRQSRRRDLQPSKTA